MFRSKLFTTRLQQRASAAAAAGSNAAVNTKPLQLPAGSNLSTLTALSLGMQLTSDAPENATASPSLLYKRSAGALPPATMTPRNGSGSSSGAGYVEPLAWMLPAHLSATSAHKVAHAAAVQQLLDTIASPNQVVAPLPLDAAVAATAEALCISRSKEAAAAAWMYALGAGKLLARLVQVAQDNPHLVALATAAPASPSSSASSAFAALQHRRDASMAVADFAAELVAVAVAQGGASPVSPAASSAARAALFASDPELMIACLSATAWAKAAVAEAASSVISFSKSQQPHVEPLSEEAAALAANLDALFVEPAMRALEQRCALRPSDSALDSTACALVGLQQMCAVADPVRHAPRLLRLLQEQLRLRPRGYVDAVGVAHLMSLLLRASSVSASANAGASLSPLGTTAFYAASSSADAAAAASAAPGGEQDFCGDILALWSWVQHSRAALDPRARSAVVGALALTNRIADAFRAEQRMYDEGFVLDAFAQAVLVDAVRSQARGSGSGATAVLTPGLLQALRRDAHRLYTCARTHWAFSLAQLDEGVRLRLLLLCWEAQLRGAVPRSLARTGLFPRRFVQGLVDGKDIEPGAADWAPRPEAVAVLLRCLSVTGTVVNNSSNTNGTAANNDEAASADVDEAADAAAALPQERRRELMLPLAELQLLAATALQQVGLQTEGNVALEAELWGCIFGAAAACSSRATLLDAAMALKTHERAHEAPFVEAVMLSAMDVMRAYPWELSKLVVAELARALSVQPSDLVMSRLLAMQQNSGTSKDQAAKVDVAAIVQEFFGGADQAQ